jgi:hypothetical protein
MPKSWLLAMLAAFNYTAAFTESLDRHVKIFTSNFQLHQPWVYRESLLFLVCATVAPANAAAFVERSSPKLVAQTFETLFTSMPSFELPLVNSLFQNCTQVPAFLRCCSEQFDFGTLSVARLAEQFLSMHGNTVLVCLKANQTELPVPHIPGVWLMDSLEFLRPEGVFLRIPGCVTLAKLRDILFKAGAAPARTVRSVRTEMAVLLIDGRPIHIGAQANLIRNGAALASVRVISITEKDVWLSSTGPLGVDVFAVSVASLQSGETSLTLNEETCRAVFAESVSSLCIGQLPRVDNVVDLDCELAAGLGLYA